MGNFGDCQEFSVQSLSIMLEDSSTPTWMITPNITFGFDMILRMGSAGQIYWELRKSIYNDLCMIILSISKRSIRTQLRVLPQDLCELLLKLDTGQRL